MGNRLILASLCAFLPAYAQVGITVSPSPASVHVGTFLQFSAKLTGIFLDRCRLDPDAFNGSGRDLRGRPLYAPSNPAQPQHCNRNGHEHCQPDNVRQRDCDDSESVSDARLGESHQHSCGRVLDHAERQRLRARSPSNQRRHAGMATTYISSTRLTASGVSFPVEKGWTIPIAVKNPDPGSATSTDVISVVVAPATGPHILGANVAAHFLDQAAFGPDAATLDHVETVGLENYLQEQFAAPISPYPDPATTGFGLNQVQARFFTNAVHGQDQLRQRVAFALSEIMVVSAVEENTPTQLVPYLGILQKDAFANFRTLMQDVTLSPTMGEYLDMRNNDKADPTTRHAGQTRTMRANSCSCSRLAFPN